MYIHVNISTAERDLKKQKMESGNNHVYEHAHWVWNRITPEFDNVTSGNYHDVHLVTYVLLSADVFETLQNTCLEH